MFTKLKKTLVVAEIGINHNGSLKIAKKLIDKAKLSGADVVKFQIYDLKNFLSEKNSYLSKSQKKIFEQMKNILYKNQLNFNQFKILRKYCSKKKIKFAATPFDKESFFFLKSLKPLFIKLASADLNNFELLNYVSRSKFPVILSSGMSDLREIDQAIKFLNMKKFSKIILMHCVSIYPTPINLINLKSISFLKKKFNFPIGFSDHTTSIDIPVYASVLGASVIEKHFTLDQKMKGPDHKASLVPNNFFQMVKKLREIDKILGKEIKIKNSLEKNIEWVAKRSIYASEKILKGQKFTIKNINFLRPQIQKQKIDKFKIYNLKSKKNYNKGDLIN